MEKVKAASLVKNRGGEHQFLKKLSTELDGY
jgi:hypothetical protein